MPPRIGLSGFVYSGLLSRIFFCRTWSSGFGLPGLDLPVVGLTGIPVPTLCQKSISNVQLICLREGVNFHNVLQEASTHRSQKCQKTPLT